MNKPTGKDPKFEMSEFGEWQCEERPDGQTYTRDVRDRHGHHMMLSVTRVGLPLGCEWAWMVVDVTGAVADSTTSLLKVGFAPDVEKGKKAASAALVRVLSKEAVGA